MEVLWFETARERPAYPTATFNFLIGEYLNSNQKKELQAQAHNYLIIKSGYQDYSLRSRTSCLNLGPSRLKPGCATGLRYNSFEFSKINFAIAVLDLRAFNWRSRRIASDLSSKDSE